MTIERVVIVGGGLAGLRTAETLRSMKFDGSIVLIGAEESPPYDRPPLSKELLTGRRQAHDTIFRPTDHYAKLGIDLLCGQPAERLDLAAQTVQAGDQTHLFDRLVIATGARPRHLVIGRDLAGVHVLRTLADATDIRRLLTTGRPRVVVVGAGFIGAEVASSARTLGLDVAIVEAAPTPLARAVGSRLGDVNARLHRDSGVKLLCGVTVARIGGRDRVEQVELSDGQILECDVLVVGVGAVPDVEWLEGSGLTIDDGIICDDRLNACHPAVFAAGDMARWPNRLFGKSMRNEQWTSAVEQARYIARRLVSGAPADEPFTSSNYFWSDQHGVRIQSVGVAEPADEIRLVAGSVDDYCFLACYRSGDRLIGAFAMDCPREIMRCRQLVERSANWDTALAELQ